MQQYLNLFKCDIVKGRNQDVEEMQEREKKRVIRVFIAASNYVKSQVYTTRNKDVNVLFKFIKGTNREIKLLLQLY